MTNNCINNTTPIFIYSCLSDLLAFLFLFLLTNRRVFLNFMFMIPKNIKFKMVKMVKDDKIKFIGKMSSRSIIFKLFSHFKLDHLLPITKSRKTSSEFQFLISRTIKIFLKIILI